MFDWCVLEVGDSFQFIIGLIRPVLFLLYINDVVNVIDPGTVYLYADDTVLYVSGIDKTVVQVKFQNILDKFLSSKILTYLLKY